ncbi:MAG: DegT/DnrJ/EryC1/StrS family aminotransferase [Bacteroidetes bacterium]|jgi:UDP-2-acetamido-2-deoxy-ribo-hexuluronate aminotransferase|nr:DegT/DnrJ/EryC1/StrS family aminotransferase [Bacteroidota bacterium]MBK9481877.1 DegT/DnrJ/EryC1/StrS family aminotransferase [Bacteroidota bacterium]
MMNLQMVDLKSQYEKIKDEVNASIQEVIDTTAFINGPQVKTFSANLEKYLGVKHVIPCANGTDALQIAMMALDLQPGDEIITPSYTYFATVEVVGLLQLTPVFCEVDKDTFSIDVNEIEKLITPKTKAIVPVHLFGQSADMEPILAIAKKHGLYVIEDNAQAIGGYYTFSDGTRVANGCMGTIGTTSFFPSKNLGCYGDGGAIFTNDNDLAVKLKMVANHGQKEKYIHEIIGCNSRLDTMQAAILNVKLPHLDSYCDARRKVADYYDAAFAGNAKIKTPFRAPYSHHVYHQYTIQLQDGINRNEVMNRLKELGIPSMVYYPIPAHKQKMFENTHRPSTNLDLTNWLVEHVISLPIHTEMTSEQMEYICTHFLNIINTL